MAHANSDKEDHSHGGRRRVGAAVLLAIATALCLVIASVAWHGLPASLSQAGAAVGIGRSAGNARSAAGASRGARTVSDRKAPSGGVDVRLVMVGDVLQHTGVFQSGLQPDGSYNFDHVFAHVRDRLVGADLKIVNQETPLGGTVAPYSGYPVFNGPQEMGDAEAAAGFNVVLKASNHAMDMGYGGISSEVGFWRTHHPDVAVIGMVDPTDDVDDSPDDVYVYEKDGFRVAVVNYTYGLNGFQDPKGAVSMLTEDHVRRTMAYANEHADMVVTCPHWGTEYVTEATGEQRKWERLLVECGADVILGGHPHVIEPVEAFDRPEGGRGVCFWSVGNFVSTMAGDECLVGGMAEVTLHKGPDGTCSVTSYALAPLVTHKGTGDQMTTYPLSQYTDALAATNALGAYSNTSCTPSWVQGFSASVLGEKYDPQSSSLFVELDPAA